MLVLFRVRVEHRRLVLGSLEQYTTLDSCGLYCGGLSWDSFRLTFHHLSFDYGEPSTPLSRISRVG
jgi:hypothetical protein